MNRALRLRCRDGVPHWGNIERPIAAPLFASTAPSPTPSGQPDETFKGALILIERQRAACAHNAHCQPSPGLCTTLLWSAVQVGSPHKPDSSKVEVAGLRLGPEPLLNRRPGGAPSPGKCPFGGLASMIRGREGGRGPGG